MEPIKRRGRPKKSSNGHSQTRADLIRAGLELMTEKGFSATGLDEILRRVDVPKGSFYHYFKSKEDFGAVLIESYGKYFAAKIDLYLLDQSLSNIERFQGLVADLRKNIIKYDFKRGCLIGNLGQEMNVLPPSFRQQLIDIFNDWQRRTTNCFIEAQKAGELSDDIDCTAMSEVFWIGWEGAVLRAKLERNAAPLDRFSNSFLVFLSN